ncbi:MAG: HigA family addiction module antitoxin [Reyranellaceae bacterium]
MTRPPIHPGEILADALAERGVPSTQLSRQIAVPPNRISRMIQRRRSITGDSALRLGHWFKTSDQFRHRIDQGTWLGHCIARPVTGRQASGSHPRVACRPRCQRN